MERFIILCSFTVFAEEKLITCGPKGFGVGQSFDNICLDGRIVNCFRSCEDEELDKRNQQSFHYNTQLNFNLLSTDTSLHFKISNEYEAPNKTYQSLC